MFGIVISSFKIALKNWSTLLLFEILYKVISFSLIFPFVNDMILLMMNILGVTHLSIENLYLIITEPLVILMALTILSLVALCIYFEITALIIYCENGWREERINIWTLWKSAFFKSIQLFRLKNLIVFLGLILVIPFSFFAFVSNILYMVRIPEYIMEFIQNNKLLFVLFMVLIAAVNYLLFLYLFGIPSVVLNDRSFIGSWKSSLELLEHRKLKTAGTLLFCLTICVLFFLLAFAAAVAVMAAYSRLNFPSDESEYIFRLLYTGWSRIGLIVFITVSSTLILAAIIIMYHMYRGDIKPDSRREVFALTSVLWRGAVALCTIFLLILYSETELGGNLIYSYEPSTQVIAHRAGAAFAPENTLAALNNAVDSGADAAEIDVQQLRDGTLIVMHDSNLKRTAGINKNVWEVDYHAVKNFDAGAWHSYEFAQERIPTLDEMFKASKNKIRLMIELKLTGHEQNLEQQTLKLIKDHDMINQCSIASMNIVILKRINELEPRIETVYITPVLISDRYNLDYIDSYSVETTSLTKEMVSIAHFQRKKIYGWTANSEATMKKILWTQADGLVTDNPELARYYIEQVGENLLLNSLVEIFFGK